MHTSDNNSTNIRTVSAEFTGKSGEFFKIWVVNILLSILTLGIYSAWAKVRTHQYLHGHTRLEDHSFRYLATPIQILKGRLLAVFVLIILSVLSAVLPIMSIIIPLLLVCATPWLIIQGLRFSMRMTSYRNIRFSFDGRIIDVVINFIVLPVLAIFTLYLAMPWIKKRMDKFIFDNITYGGQKFRLNTDTGQYYVAVLIASAVVTIGMIVVGVAVAIMGGLAALQADAVDLEAMKNDPMMMIMLSAMIFAGYMLMVALYFVSFAVYRGIILKHITESLDIEGIAKFKTSMTIMSYIKLALTNTLILVCTFGLGYPITVIRKNHYIASHLTVELTEQADKLVNTVDGQDASFGEEAAGLFDADLSFT
ncbi:MAG: DUF898 domain-containing protein [Shewanella sp.]|nr:DUF898 domain-containing protein [Shewanella sp.]